MMSRRALLIAGFLLIVGSSAVFSYPQSSADEEQMQGDDDFDYGGEDQSAPSPQMKSSNASTSEKINITHSVMGVRGEDVGLKCDVARNLTSSDIVVLWYFGNRIITNGKSLVQPNFKLDDNYDLTILKASPKDAGTYVCKVLPSGSMVNTVVTFADHSLDAIAPESSTSAAGSASSFLGYAILGSTISLILGMGKH